MNYQEFLDYIASIKGISPAALEEAMEKIAFHETGAQQRMSPAAKQLGGGPGRGLFMFEIGPRAGAITAVNRTVNHFRREKLELPRWLSTLYKGKSLDASTLSPSQQKYIFLGNYLEHPRADLSQLSGGDDHIADFWLNYHWAGSRKDREARLNSFYESLAYMNKETKYASLREHFKNWRSYLNK